MPRHKRPRGQVEIAPGVDSSGVKPGCSKDMEVATAEADMLEVDASILEGGGQILRMTMGFAALLNKPVFLSKIRAGRSKPGLKAQHSTGLNLVCSLCDGEIRGNTINSSQVAFRPGVLKGGNVTADTGTAGSCMLLMQVSLPCALFSPYDSYLTLRGGTNASMAPQLDYTTDILLPFLKTHFGLNVEVNAERRGYFPKGGGIVHVSTKPHAGTIPAVVLTERGDVTVVRIRSFVAGNIPFHVAERIAKSAAAPLEAKGFKCEIQCVKEERAFGAGCGLIAVAETSGGCLLAASGLGAPKVTSEQVGVTCGEELLTEIEHGACVDCYMQDQIIIYMALAKGVSRVRVGPLTLHTQTAMAIAEMLTGARFKTVQESADSFIIECTGVGYTSPTAA